MRYHDPQTVISPRDYVDNVRVLYDGGDASFSIALIEFEGADHFAMRWNVARREWDDPDKQNLSKICMGMPSSRSMPVWFILPDQAEIFNFIDVLKKSADKITNEKN
jgi:hypothetical protein